MRNVLDAGDIVYTFNGPTHRIWIVRFGGGLEEVQPTVRKVPQPVPEDQWEPMS